MQSNGNSIFVGIKINNLLRDQLDNSNASMKQFFSSNDPEFLQVIGIDSDDYIGKMITSGVSLEVLVNMLMNVKTMLRMICPKFSFSDDAIKILALTTTSSSGYYRGAITGL